MATDLGLIDLSTASYDVNAQFHIEVDYSHYMLDITPLVVPQPSLLAPLAFLLACPALRGFRRAAQARTRRT